MAEAENLRERDHVLTKGWMGGGVVELAMVFHGFVVNVSGLFVFGDGSRREEMVKVNLSTG